MMIPLFAIIYAFVLPARSFYHLSAKFEPSTDIKRTDIESALTALFGTRLVTGKPVYDGWIIDSVKIENFYTDENVQFDQPTFEIHVSTHREPRSIRANTLPNIITQVVIERQSRVSLPYLDPHPTIAAHTISVIHFISWVFPDSVVFPPPAPIFSPQQKWLAIPISLENQIVEYDDTKRGFPTLSRWDQFGRMIYLSATTITTLGYGDIVPITSWARVLTGFEAVAGLVIIGFFLNELAVQIRRRS